MTTHDHFFSKNATAMRESAIRQMGSVLAQSAGMISFAPGYPAEEVFPWQEFRAIAAEMLSGADGSVLQYGPTRGFLPLREINLGIMRDRGDREHRRSAWWSRPGRNRGSI